MPYIKIWERDDTGREYDGSETVIFVPGIIDISSVELDDNNCFLIAPSKGEDATLNLPTELKGNSYIEELLKAGLYVLYCKVNKINRYKITVADNKYKFTIGEKEYTIDEDGKIKDSEALEVGSIEDGKALIENILYTFYKDSDNKYFETTSSTPADKIDYSTSLDIEFLKDKYNYNIKFLTVGDKLIVQDWDTPEETLPVPSSDIETDLLDSLHYIASERGDCCVIGSVAVTPKVNLTQEELLNEATLYNIKKALNKIKNTPSYKNASLFAAKIVKDDINTYPDLAYLKAYGQAIKDNNQWEALANSVRGTIPEFKKIAAVSKYDLDNLVMNTNGYSFNGLIQLNPQTSVQGGIIWGDRTLTYNTDTTALKATSFLSIRNMVSDIAKRAYYSAIRYTFETNNDVTWINFKGRITDLLDQMVADYKIASYKVIKKPTQNRAEIKCEIHISPYGPIEDFDIGIILTNTNAEVTLGV